MAEVRANTQHQVDSKKQTITAYIAGLTETLANVPLDTVERIVEILEETRSKHKRVILFGNGGSAATASHLVCDLAKTAIVSGKPRLRVVALTDNLPLFSAWANDSCYEDVFVQQLENQLDPGDVAIGISGSGRSPNVTKALKLARSAGAVTIGLTGFDGGDVKSLVDICLVVPSNCMEQVEDIHLILGHAIATSLRGKGPA